tara:strand:- start:635 stop:1342 length:708 start_codon:yes stop_codon:yes gene_type:complete
MFDLNSKKRLKYYVYALIDPRDGNPFYIGKGKGNRLYNHVNDAVKTSQITDKLDVIREIRSSGNHVRHVIIRHGLDEDDAFKIESSLIDLLDHIGFDLRNSVLGHHSMEFGIMTANEIKRLYNAPPLKKLYHEVVIININKTYQRGKGKLSIYDVTHEAWIISEKRRAILQYALSEYRGIIVGVFEINDWYQIKKSNRWGFNGKEAPATINELYLNKSIKHVKKKGASNPIRYRL